MGGGWGRGSWYKQLIQAVGQTARQEYNNQLAEEASAHTQPQKSRRIDKKSSSSSIDSQEWVRDGASGEGATSPLRADTDEDARPSDCGISSGEEF